MIKKVFFISLAILFTCYAQDDLPEIDIFVIDSYVTPEQPYKVIITFFTSEGVKSKIKFDGNDEIIVSDNFVEDHRFEIPLNKLKYDSTSIPYRIIVETEKSKTIISDEFDLYLPEDYILEITNNSNFIDLCLGGILYLMPSPTLTNIYSSPYFSLTKEFPIISFYNSGYNYPSSYISFEYSYIFRKNSKEEIYGNPNFFRVGYKYIFQTNIIKYISPGINLTTNFAGFDAVSPEISFGLFKFYETFTLYIRARYNYEFDYTYGEFFEFSVGLFTSSISFNF